MEFTDYIKPELIIVAVALYFLDMGIRKSGAVKEKFIPLIIGAAGIVICGLYVFAACECMGPADIAMAAFTSVTQGLVVAGVSIFAKQIIKRSEK